MKALLLALALLPAAASAAYDSTWYKASGWSGEYPNGFSVVAKKTSVPARGVMDLDAAADIKCELPYLAVFHPWNAKRKASYVTMSKIVILTVKNDFTFQDEDTKIDLKKGDTIEYLVYGAEGWFTVRINGKEYGADQSLFDQVEPVDEGAYRQDEWLNITCKNGKKAWILLDDLTKTDGDGNSTYLPGLDSWYLGFKEYGEVRDLTEKDIKGR
jgi:hypothetical protein